MKSIILNLIGFIYENIFKEKMGDEAWIFIKNISYIMVGSIIAAIFSFIFNILAGRILGPAVYGQYTLVLSIATFLLIPMLFGVDTAMVKYNSEKNDFRRQSTIISTTYLLVIIFTLICIFGYYLFYLQILKIFSISTEIFALAIIFAVLSAFSSLMTSTLRSLHMMEEYARFQPLSSFILLITFAIFFFFNSISLKSVMVSTFFAAGITGSIILITLNKYLKSDFNVRWANELIRYGIYAIIGGVSSVVYTNTDKILIYKYLTITDVGIYQAYYFASINVIGLLTGGFLAAFFPMVSKYEGKQIIFNKLKVITPNLILFGLPSLILIELIILKLYGSAYIFDLKLALLFAIAGICICIYSMYAWFISAIGRLGLKIGSFSAIIIGLVNVFLNVILIPLIRTEGAIAATIISYIVGIIIITSKINSILNEKK